MSGFDGSVYQPTIDAILSVSDLEKVSVKRIRGALEKLFVVEFLNENKRNIKDLILSRYDEYTKGNIQCLRFLTKDEIAKEDAEKKRKWASELKQSAPKTKKQKTKSNNQDTEEDGTPTKPRGWSAIKLHMSPQLSNLLQLSPEEQIARPECVKKIWEYIKAHDLQNPNDKREIICDDSMRKLFGDRIHMFTMNKFLGLHLSKDLEIIKKEVILPPKNDDSNGSNDTSLIKGEFADLEKDVEDILKHES